MRTSLPSSRYTPRKPAAPKKTEGRFTLPPIPQERYEQRGVSAPSKHTRGRARHIINVQDGPVLVVSDPHYYPGDEPSVAHRAAIQIGKKLGVWAVIVNGDAIDGASISRWPVGSFAELGERPKVSDEMWETGKRLAEFETITSAEHLVWTLGNHDARFETKLADRVPEYDGVPGFKLKDHFPVWSPAWGVWFQHPKTEKVEVVVKHRFKGGMYSANNNALWAGTSMVTGHLHQLWYKPITDLTGTRWGIEAGTLSNIYSPHFQNYTEDNPINWQSGFVILHFKNGQFVGPELVHALPNDTVWWRGERIKVR